MRRVLWRPGDPMIPLMTQRNVKSFNAAFERRNRDECWPWTNAKDRHGYGMFKLGGLVRVGAHRLMYALAYGEPGVGHVCHSCDNPPCVNPEHLFLGSAKINALDKVQKGRARGGRVQSVPSAPVPI